jgi:hypothetical protein
LRRKADYHVRHRDNCTYSFLTVLIFYIFHGNDEDMVWRKPTEEPTPFSAGRRTKDWLCPPPGREVSREEVASND